MALGGVHIHTYMIHIACILWPWLKLARIQSHPWAVSEAAVVELDVYRGSVGLDVDLLDGGELDPGDRAARSHT